MAPPLVNKISFGAVSIWLVIKRQYNLLLLLAGGCHEWPPSSGVDVTMSDANAEFIDALIRLLLEPVIFPFTLFLIIAAIAIIIAILNILLGG